MTIAANPGSSGRAVLLFVFLVVALQLLSAQQIPTTAVASPTLIGPAHGVLALDGGPEATPAVARRFVELAGGDKAKIVLIPTAAGDDAARDPATVASYRKLFGSGCCAIVHTTQRTVADRADFVKPLADATGVWMMGGKPSALPDAYWHTATERALREVLERGGVVGGSSAGALIQGSRIPTSHPDNGFAFLRNTFIMPHLNRNNARNMLVGIVGETVGIIGIGISENTAAIVTRDHLEVVGNGEVVVVDGRLRAGKQYIVLQPGERFDLVPRAPQAP